jgi:tripartite-type tricarboxylate transporter receptor subunit TctC
MLRRHCTPAICRLVVLACTLPLAATAAGAETFPVKPVRLIVPFAPGGGADLNARRLADQMEKFWKQPMVVQNMGGGGGNVAAAATANSEPSGYTMMFASLSALANNPTIYNGKPPVDTDKVLAPVVLIGAVPLVLMVGANSPATDVKSLIALAKKNPKSFYFGSGGVGTSMHLTGELFKAATNTSLTHVPFKGASRVAAAIMGGEIQIIFQNAGLAATQIKTGRLKVLAIASDKRMAILPDLPTFTEAGLRDFRAAITYGIYVPAETPANMIATLNRDINAVLRNPAYVSQMSALGVELMGGSPRQLHDYVLAERKKWAPVIRRLGLKGN